MVFPRNIIKGREFCEPVLGMKLGHCLKQLPGDRWEDPRCLMEMGSGRRQMVTDL